MTARSTQGFIQLGPVAIPCRIGRSGRRHLKREGDGATPVGTWTLIGCLYRADRLRRPRTALPLRTLAAEDGWCDATTDRNYNRPVRLPYPASHEEMWRTDGLYDIVVVLSHNRRPRLRGAGSAVFFHLTGQPPAATAGCISVSRRDMLRILEVCGPGTRLRVWS